MKNIFEFNHIDKSLSKSDVKTLKDFYSHYHKKYWCFKKSYKSYKFLDGVFTISSISSMEKVISDSLNDIYEYYYFAPETYTDEKNCIIPSKASGAYSEFESFIKSNKIPHYAREYKREYLFIIGLNYEFRYFIYKPEDVSVYEFFNNLHVKRIIN